MIYERVSYFLKTAEYGSFSKAAKELYISPQALTKQIDVLEEELGQTLFERNSKGVSLTNFGRFAQEKLTIAQENYEQALSQVIEAAKNDKPRINIGVFAALPQEEIVAPLVTYMLANYTDYQIALELIELEEGREKLLKGKLDLLLTNTHEEDEWPNCECYSYGETTAQVLVSLNHPWAIQNAITIDDMKSQDFLKMDMGKTNYKVPVQNSFYENIPCKRVIKVANFNTLLTLLSQGNAFAVAPMVFSNADQAHIKHFEYPDKTIQFRTALIYNTKNRIHPLDKIVAELVDEFDLCGF